MNLTLVLSAHIAANLIFQSIAVAGKLLVHLSVYPQIGVIFFTLMLLAVTWLVGWAFKTEFLPSEYLGKFLGKYLETLTVCGLAGLLIVWCFP